MCTVVVRWEPGAPVRVLALRDELVGRAFDDPGTWWPSSPVVVGGRDRQAGGTWCATNVVTGTTALVLNRPQRPVAEPGAPSRGVLPLMAAAAGPAWPSTVRTAGMASFTLVLVGPDELTTWEYDGATLTSASLDPGTHMVTSGGVEDRRAERHLASFTATDDWRGLVTGQTASDDAAALLVRHELGERVFATVFAQTLDSVPGRLSVSSSRTPADAETWSSRTWPG